MPGEMRILNGRDRQSCVLGLSQHLLEVVLWLPGSSYLSEGISLLQKLN